MGLLYHDVTLLNVDDAYAWQRKLSRQADEWIQLADIDQSNLYCTMPSREEMRRRLSRRRGRGITFIGNGNYHYITYLLLGELERPFTLILFDNHTDAEQGDGLLSCGSWVAEALSRLTLLKRVLIVGAKADRHSRLSDGDSHIMVWPEPANTQQLLDAIPTPDVYISIDKDVLDRTFAVTNWDHGSMRLGELLAYLRTIVRNKRVNGVDVCGELPVSPVDVWRYEDKLRRNEQANLAILQAVQCA